MLGRTCPWYVAGPALGGIVVALRWLANKPLGALGGYVDAAERLMGRSPTLGWRSYFLSGIVLGGVLSAVLIPERAGAFAYGAFDQVFSPSLPLKASVLTSAGVLMGYGARLGGGCTSGHGLCGVALGSRASVIATAVFFAAAVATAHLVALLSGGRP